MASAGVFNNTCNTGYNIKIVNGVFVLTYMVLKCKN
jgi:hypothetical protein